MRNQKTLNIVGMLFIAIFLLTFGVLAQNGDNGTNEAEKKQDYDIAAYVWPSYHPDDRAKIFWPDGIGEWQSVISNTPKYEGHDQPRFPLWGYVNEADPYIAEMEINAAADHGVNVFIFDWYWYDGMPFLEGHLNEGYLKARNNDRVKFYIMWANHDVNQIWDKRRAGLPNEHLIWKGGVDREDFEVVCHRIIEQYFGHPSYYKVDGKPSFMIYDIGALIEGLGGEAQALDALQWFREETQKAGYPGLDLQVSLRKGSKNLTADDGSMIGAYNDVVHQLKFDGITHYQFVHFTDIDRDYLDIMPDVIAEWDKVSANKDVPYYPHVSVGWDNNPRFLHFKPGVVTNNTPDNFEKALRDAKEYVDEHPGQAPLITINSWNEWTETSYLMPCTLYGYGYLQAIQNVFVSDK